MKFKKYVIKKGKHDYFNFPKLTFNNKIEADIIFNESWKYNLKDIDQFDINKIIGLSDNWSFHKNNSARIGCTYNLETKKLDLYAYIYNNKERIVEKLYSINFNTEIKLKIEFKNKLYIFSINNTVVKIIDRKFMKIKLGLKYKLLPYFGGNKKAPHDIITLIKWL